MNFSFPYFDAVSTHYIDRQFIFHLILSSCPSNPLSVRIGPYLYLLYLFWGLNTLNFHIIVMCFVLQDFFIRLRPLYQDFCGWGAGYYLGHQNIHQSHLQRPNQVNYLSLSFQFYRSWQLIIWVFCCFLLEFDS